MLGSCNCCWREVVVVVVVVVVVKVVGVRLLL